MSRGELLLKLGNVIRVRRRSLNISQTKLGNMLGFESAAYICNIEKGRSSMPVHTLRRMEEILGPLWSEV